MEQPRISVIIPTYHSRTIARTIQALIEQQPTEALVEILVAGQQEMDELAALPKVRYVHVTENSTPAHHRNAGAIQAKGDWLYFIDSDCVPQADWLAQIIKAIQTEPAMITGAVAIPDETGYWGQCDHLVGYDGVLAGVDQLRAVTVAPSSNFGITRHLFLQLGGFDEQFQRNGEDYDFCLRLGAAGHTIQFIPEIVVCHRHGHQDLKSTWRHLYKYGEGAALRRLVRGGDWRWQLASKAVSMPLVCEMVGIGRILVGTISKFWHKPRYSWQNIHLYPGIMVLEFALRLGMIQYLRKSQTAVSSKANE